MNDYDHYNREGIVTRDTGDLAHVPEHVRITRHPERDRKKKQAEPAPSIRAELSKEQVEAVKRDIKAGRTRRWLSRKYSVSEHTIQALIWEVERNG